MTATTATDAASAPVEYNHAIDGTYQGWQSSPTRIFNGLMAATEYAFRVKARDALGNETTQSTEILRTTEQAQTSTTGNPSGNRGTRALMFGAF